MLSLRKVRCLASENFLVSSFRPSPNCVVLNRDLFMVVRLAIPFFSSSAWSIQSLLEVVAAIPHDRVLEGIWTLEEIGALLPLIGSCIRIHVFVEQFPEVIGQTEGFEVAGVTATEFANAIYIS